MSIDNLAQSRGLRSYDHALPNEWVDDMVRVNRAYPDSFVWSYDKASIFGRPEPLTPEAVRQLLAWHTAGVSFNPRGHKAITDVPYPGIPDMNCASCDTILGAQAWLLARLEASAIKGGWVKVCQIDWEFMYPGEYAPDVTNYGTCALCGEDGLVYGTRIRDARKVLA